MSSDSLAAAWPEQPLDSLLVFLTSGSRGWSQYYSDSGSPFIRIQNVGRNKILLDDLAFVAAPDTAEATRTRVKPGDVLLSITADLGRTAVVPAGLQDAFINQHLAILRVKDVDAQYLSAFLSSPAGQAQILSRNRHGVKAGLNFDDIRSFRIPTPPLPEQRRIAEVLDRAEALRAKRSAALALLDTLTQSIFLELFGDPIENPHHFPTDRLLSLVDGDRGISYGVVQRGEHVEGGVPIVRIRDVVGGEIRASHLLRTSTEVARKYRRTVLRGGEIVISIRGTVGRCALVPRELVGGNITRELALIPQVNTTASVFLLALLRTESVQRKIKGDVKGIAQSGINLRDLRELPVIDPPPDLVSQFVETATSVSRLLSAHRASLAKLDELFASLQHRAFLGEL
jgi:type I restriction enzyme, S subunit